MSVEKFQIPEKKEQNLTPEQLKLNVEAALKNALEFIGAINNNDTAHGEHLKDDLLKMINNEVLQALDAKAKYEAMDNVYNG